MHNYYILLTFLLTTICLLQVNVICLYCIKRWLKEKGILPYYYIKMESNNELK